MHAWGGEEEQAWEKRSRAGIGEGEEEQAWEKWRHLQGGHDEAVYEDELEAIGRKIKAALVTGIIGYSAEDLFTWLNGNGKWEECFNIFQNCVNSFFRNPKRLFQTSQFRRRFDLPKLRHKIIIFNDLSVSLGHDIPR